MGCVPASGISSSRATPPPRKAPRSLTRALGFRTVLAPREGMLRVAAASFLFLALTGCRPLDHRRNPRYAPPGPVRREVGRYASTVGASVRYAWWHFTSPRCAPPALLDTTSWRRVTAESGTTLLLPPEFVLDTNARGIDTYVRVWRRGATEVQWRRPGSWSEPTFETPRNRDGSDMARCRWRLGGRSVVASMPEGLPAVYRAYGPYGRWSPFRAPSVLARSPAASDTLLFWTIARTVHLSPRAE